MLDRTLILSLVRNKKIIIFDLDDTLTASKQRMTERMATALAVLSKSFYIAIISGCKWEQMQTQVLNPLVITKANIDKLWFLPTSGSAMITIDGTPTNNMQTRYRYKNDLTLAEKVSAWYAFSYAKKRAINEQGFPDNKITWGEVTEDRGSQVTFSILGQNAPLEEKILWNKQHGEKRYWLAEKMRAIIVTGLSVQVGGTTSIDVMRSNSGKANGVRQLAQVIPCKIEDMFFVGDKLQLGGNDYPVKETGISSFEVKNCDETLELIRIINET